MLLTAASRRLKRSTPLGLVAPHDPAATVLHLKSRRTNPAPQGERSWPDYDRCLEGAPRASEGGGPDRSIADFFWCKMAAQRGWSVDEIADKLMEVSNKAQERARLRDEGYALITAQNAAAAFERDWAKGAGDETKRSKDQTRRTPDKERQISVSMRI